MLRVVIGLAEKNVESLMINLYVNVTCIGD